MSVRADVSHRINPSEDMEDDAHETETDGEQVENTSPSAESGDGGSAQASTPSAEAQLDAEEAAFNRVKRDPASVKGASAAGMVTMSVAKIPPKNTFFRTQIGAMRYYGLDAMSEKHKDAMRDRIMKGFPFIEQELCEIQRYCGDDVDALVGLLEKILAGPDFDLEVALHHGEFAAACAQMEYWGVPLNPEITGPLLSEKNWREIRNTMIPIINEKYRVYVQQKNGDWSFNKEQFVAYLRREGILEFWPRTEKGDLKTDDKTFEDMCDAYERLQGLRQLKHMCSKMRKIKLAVGGDWRNRTVLWPFQSKTSRTQPKASKWIFSPAVWLRFLIKPEPGMALAYIDYSSMEFLIAASLSDKHCWEDENLMLQAYLRGDPYLDMCKRFRVVPADATKKTHRAVREKYKQTVLSALYGISAVGLSRRLGIPDFVAHEMLIQIRELFMQYWRWSDDWLHHSLDKGTMRTRMGWTCTTGITETNERSIRNWPVQSTGADILRVAIIWGIKRGIKILAPVHDAVLIEAPIDRIDADVAMMQEIMRRASRIVLGGHELRSEAKIIRYPEHYTDERGEEMWAKVTGLLEEITARDAARKDDAV